MGHHGTRSRGSSRRTTPASGCATLTVPRRRGVSPATSGTILVAAVAAGAALPALQTLDTHVADAEAPRTAEAATAGLALAAANQRTPRPCPTPSPGDDAEHVARSDQHVLGRRVGRGRR